LAFSPTNPHISPLSCNYSKKTAFVKEKSWINPGISLNFPFNGENGSMVEIALGMHYIYLKKQAISCC
jgi:hypothetical protein